MPKLKFNAATKAKAVLEVLRERKTANEIAKDFAVHPTQLSTWKTQALANLPSLFESPADKTSKDQLEPAARGERASEALRGTAVDEPSQAALSDEPLLLSRLPSWMRSAPQPKPVAPSDSSSPFEADAPAGDELDAPSQAELGEPIIDWEELPGWMRAPMGQGPPPWEERDSVIEAETLDGESFD